MSTLNDWLAHGQNRKLYAEERLIVEVAEEIWRTMERAELSKSNIAAALGKSKAFVTQVMSGTRNMTLRTLADIAFSMGTTVRVTMGDHSKLGEWHQVPDALLVNFRPPVFLGGMVKVGNDNEWQSFRQVEWEKVRAA